MWSLVAVLTPAHSCGHSPFYPIVPDRERTRASTHSCTLTLAHSRIHTLMHAHSRTLAHPHTHARSLSHTRASTHSCTLTLAHLRIHTLMHAHSRTLAQKRTVGWTHTTTHSLLRFRIGTPHHRWISKSLTTSRHTRYRFLFFALICCVADWLAGADWLVDWLADWLAGGWVWVRNTMTKFTQSVRDGLEFFVVRVMAMRMERLAAAIARDCLRA
jgi:hypothetical protein